MIQRLHTQPTKQISPEENQKTLSVCPRMSGYLKTETFHSDVVEGKNSTTLHTRSSLTKSVNNVADNDPAPSGCEQIKTFSGKKMLNCSI